MRPALLLSALCSVFCAAPGAADDLPRGKPIDVVICQADKSQSYALYIPSTYTPDKKWPLLLAFDARALGDVPVKLYSEAAEKFGYIVAGSNNSRNGPVEPEYAAAAAMQADVTARFSIDPNRVYVTGHSGGARLAIDLALRSKGKIQGVIASSAGLPPEMGLDVELPFVIFGTAGTEDFNYLELTRLDRNVNTPHRIRIFSGGHTWPPRDFAVEAIEWLEVQAMRTGTKPRDEAMIQKLFDARRKELADAPGRAEAYYVNFAIATEFDGLKDVTNYVFAEQRMADDEAVIAALRLQVMADLAENQLGQRMRDLTGLLDVASARASSLEELKTMVERLGTQARAAEDSPERQRARRMLSDTIAYNNARPGGRQDAEYVKVLDAASFPRR